MHYNTRVYIFDRTNTTIYNPWCNPSLHTHTIEVHGRKYVLFLHRHVRGSKYFKIVQIVLCSCKTTTIISYKSGNCGRFELL